MSKLVNFLNNVVLTETVYESDNSGRSLGTVRDVNKTLREVLESRRLGFEEYKEGQSALILDECEGEVRYKYLTSDCNMHYYWVVRVWKLDTIEVQETRTNQYGEEIPTKIVTDLGDGLKRIEVLTCWGSDSVGMGTCRCVSHEPYTEYYSYKGYSISHDDYFLLLRFPQLEKEGLLRFEEYMNVKEVYINIPHQIDSHVVWYYDEYDQFRDGIYTLKETLWGANRLLKKLQNRGLIIREIFSLGKGLWKVRRYVKEDNSIRELFMNSQGKEVKVNNKFLAFCQKYGVNPHKKETNEYKLWMETPILGNSYLKEVVLPSFR